MRVDRPDRQPATTVSAPSTTREGELAPSMAPGDSLALGEATRPPDPLRSARVAASADTVTGAAVRAVQGKAVRPGLVTAFLNARFSKELTRALGWMAQGSRLVQPFVTLAARLRVVTTASTAAGVVFATQDTHTAMREQASPQVSADAKRLNWTRVALGWTGVGLGAFVIVAGLAGAGPGLVAAASIAAAVVGLAGFAVGLVRATRG
jgi:hypothetical protein